MIGAGLITAVPLLRIALATQRRTLMLAGILHYIAPTKYFLIEVFIYVEPLTAERLIGFRIIRPGLAIFAAEGIYHRGIRVVVLE